MLYLAIDVGGTYTKYALITEQCQIMDKGKRPTRKESMTGFVDSLVELYQDVSREHSGEQLDGIALSMAGMIDSRKGFMHTGGSIFCIENLNIVEQMEERCRVPVTVENDAKCAAYAELWIGALADVENGVVMVCGTAVGGAVLRNREVIPGEHLMAGEFSYVMTESTPEYSMDHTLAGSTGIESLIKYVSEETGVAKEELDGERIFALANNGDERVLKGLRRYIRNLALQIHNLQFILDPERFAIGGGISAQPLFLQMIREELDKIIGIFPWKLPKPEVVTCQYFNDANLIGAVYVHLQRRQSEHKEVV